MTDTTEPHTAAFETNSFTVTRLEGVTVIGALLILASLVLPWASDFSGSMSGFAFTWLSPVFVVGALSAVVLSIPGHRSGARYASIAVLGVVHAAVGVILILGIPSRIVDVGVIVFTVGGVLVAVGGYWSLVRETSTYRATAIVCLGSLITLVVGIVGMQTI